MEKYLSKEYIDGLNVQDFILYAKFVECIGYYTEFKLYKRVLKMGSSYSNAENLSELASFVVGRDVPPSELMISEEEKYNEIIDKYADLEKGFEGLSFYNISKKEAKKLLKNFKRGLLSMPHYYYSMPYIFRYIVLYRIGEYTYEEIAPNLSIINLGGGKDLLPVKTFELFLEQLSVIR